MNTIPLLLPSIAEQQKIAKFLDKKCGEVDEMIALQEQIIEELKAYKQSVITEAVTKGLNPNVPMKDSGIEWIGEIPEHWDCRKIGTLFRLREEKNYKSMEDVQLLSLYTGIGVFPHGEQEERGNKAVTVEGYKVVHKNDIVVNIILAWMGAIGVSDYDGVTSPAYDVYIPSTSVIPHYYHYVFRTKGIATECYKYGRGIMMMRWRTYSSEFKQISIRFLLSLCLCDFNGVCLCSYVFVFTLMPYKALRAFFIIHLK
jgi:type I restriction enzyme S subunit